MRKKIVIGVLSLMMIPFVQGCDERDVATGLAVGAVVGGTILAVSSDNYRHDRYYHNRYDNYYRYRHVRYGHRYGERRYGHRYGDRHERRRRARRGFGGGRRPIVLPIAMTQIASVSGSENLLKFADFYQMPVESAQVILAAQSRALGGDLQGLVDIGLFSKDFENLKAMNPPAKETLYRMSLRTGLAEDHLNDILTDFQQELKASEKAGRIAL